MFKPGDKVVYNVLENPSSLNAGLVYQKTYIIKHKFTRWLYFDKNDSSLESDKLNREALIGPFHVDDFVLLTDLRKDKLEKLRSSKNIISSSFD